MKEAIAPKSLWLSTALIHLGRIPLGSQREKAQFIFTRWLLKGLEAADLTAPFIDHTTDGIIHIRWSRGTRRLTFSIAKAGEFCSRREEPEVGALVTHCVLNHIQQAREEMAWLCPFANGVTYDAMVALTEVRL